MAATDRGWADASADRASIHVPSVKLSIVFSAISRCFTVVAVKGRIGTPASSSTRQITPRMCAMSSALLG